MLRVYENPINKTLSIPPPPPPGWDFLRQYFFRHLIVYLFYIGLFALNILGLEKIMGHQTYVPPEL